MQNNFSKKPRKVKMINLKTNKVVKTFESISEAGEMFDSKFARVYINNCCLGRTKSALGFGWEYAD